MSTLNKMIFNPRSIIAFFMIVIYTFLSQIGLDPYKNFPKPDYPEGSLNHKYHIAVDGYDDWYGFTSMQGILNMINARDKEGIISKFSENAKVNNDISRQVDILFDYLDGEIIDFENELAGGHDNVEYGHYHNYEIWPSAEIRTKENTYDFMMSIVVMNDDESLIGIEKISVIREDIEKHYLGISLISGDDYVLPWHQPGAINCVDYNGLIR